MNVTLEVSVLRDAMARAADLIDTKLQLPIMACARVSASQDNSVTIETTDGDRWLTQTIQATHVETAGSAAIDAGRLNDIARGLPDGADLRIEIADSQARLRSGRSRITLACLPPEDFPIGGSTGAGVTPADMPARELRRMLSFAAPACSSEITRYYLCGVYLHARDDRLLAVATDGDILLRTGTDIADPAAVITDPGIIVPSQSAQMLGKLLDRDGDVTIAASPVLFTVSGEDWGFITKLIAGDYPDYPRVIPADDKVVANVSVDAEEFAGTARRMALIASKKKNDKLGWHRSLVLRAEGDHLDIGTWSETASATDRIDAEIPDGETWDGAFNVAWLNRMLAACAGAVLTIRPSADAGPVQFTPEDADAHHVALCMPYRENWHPALNSLAADSDSDDDAEA